MEGQKKMYLSLPITGRKIEKVKEYAKRLKAKWVEKGFEVVTPFEVVPVDNMPYEYCMGKDITALMLCDGIILAMIGSVQRDAVRNVRWLRFTVRP